MHEPPEPAEERPSKSQRKREMHERQALGRKLVDLGSAQLARMQLPEYLQDAIVMAQRVPGHEAKRRQLQYIGKLMREADYDAIEAAYEDLTGASRASVALMHRCERLRDELIEDDTALADFIVQHPGVDVQWLRAKIRAARQDRDSERPPKNSRELYKWLHEMLQAQPSQAGEAP